MEDIKVTVVFTDTYEMVLSAEEIEGLDREEIEALAYERTIGGNCFSDYQLESIEID